MRFMSKGQRKAKPIAFSYALRSFVGFLEGTSKSANTIKNYRSDLATFEAFLRTGLGSRPVALARVSLEDLEQFHGWLKAQGLKTNSRRRKILTARRLLKYLTVRKKIDIDAGRKIPAPQKIERVPETVDWELLIQRIRELPIENDIQARNQVLLWTLAETGCQVSEIGRLRFSDWDGSDAQGEPLLQLSGKSPRQVRVSRALRDRVRALRSVEDANRPVFLGFNRHGSMGSSITSRGVELLVKSYGSRLQFDLTPRTFRHSVVRHWLEQGVEQDEIQRRLGLKTAYAFRIYEPMLKSNLKATSSPGTS
jgi:integrase/recombinase XerD